MRGPASIVPALLPAIDKSPPMAMKTPARGPRKTAAASASGVWDVSSVGSVPTVTTWIAR